MSLEKLLITEKKSYSIIRIDFLLLLKKREKLSILKARCRYVYVLIEQAYKLELCRS